ncbi:DUF5131 family protein [Amylibacter sp. IMCC11727]|uniref:DUF5131 family protein n=1 Tax=Amylibacter sp. IMCC11727 TaxID=3039851 RepID=UPI00244DD957|nr:DUF5131 family protein [Amylibacter sp. IMCC11727]WGI22429.1 DUF5131 family protein [Amylibacter sp. IMCC11727]
MTTSGIEWTDVTWNPTAGCSILTEGCTNCYAMRMAARLEAMGVEKYAGLTRKTGGKHKWTGEIRLDQSSLHIPYSWKAPRMVFVNSMSDLFHEKLTISEISSVWKVMSDLPQHTFQVLTKRDERLRDVTKELPLLKNVWLGVSIESKTQLKRIENLRKANSFVRFISFEPLIESVGEPDLKGIDWAIVGGESGPNSRPMSKNWVEELYRASRKSDLAFHFKQWGGPQKKRNGRILHGRTYDEFPQAVV